MMTLFGTTTSPFVRKIRIHALEMGVPFTLVDTASDDGQAALRKVTPLWKVPVAVMDGVPILDSRIILRELWDRHGALASVHNLRRPGEGTTRVAEENLLTVIDGVLDSAINRFYLLRDGLPETGYIAKQKERFENALAYAATQLRGAYFTDIPKLGITEISLICALGWLTFRDQYRLADHGVLFNFARAHQGRDSVQVTAPA
jgi:glutathione S-transferase